MTANSFKEYKHPYHKCFGCNYWLTPKKLIRRVESDKMKNCCFVSMIRLYGLKFALNKCTLNHLNSFASILKQRYTGSLVSLIPKHSFIIKNTLP